MLFRDTIALIDVATTQNNLGQFIETQTATETFANEKSVRQSEFYQALASNLRPEIAFEVRTIDYSEQKRIGHIEKITTAGAGTTTTVIKLANHGLKVGDIIINKTRSLQRQVLSVVDTNTVTVTAIATMVAGDEIKWYTQKYEILRTYSKNQEITELICQKIVLGG